MINVGIDVHKRRCVVAIKDDSGKLLERATFENNAAETAGFAEDIKKRYAGRAHKGCMRVHCRLLDYRTRHA